MAENGCCETTTITVGESRAEQVGSVCITQPHIVNYPKPPPRDDGFWWATGTVLSAITSLFSNQKKMKDAGNLESAARKLVDTMSDRGFKDWRQAELRRAQAYAMLEGVRLRVHEEHNFADQESDYAGVLEPKVDQLIDDVFLKIDTLSRPNYEKAARIVKGGVEQSIQASRNTLERTRNRYNTGAYCCGEEELMATRMNALITGLNQAYDSEYDKYVKGIDRKDAFLTKLEATRQARNAAAADMRHKALTVEQQLFQNILTDSQTLEQLGMDIAGSTAKSYVWLAGSLRETARGLSGARMPIIAMVAMMVTGWYKSYASARDPCNKADQGVIGNAIDKIKGGLGKIPIIGGILGG